MSINVIYYSNTQFLFWYGVTHYVTCILLVVVDLITVGPTDRKKSKSIDNDSI